MKLARLPHDPMALADFFQDGLESLGAVCERTWHDRLQLVAEGPVATLWNPSGVWTEVELEFLTADDPRPRQAGHQVFPGCPLTFQLAERLQPVPPVLDRVILQVPEALRPPNPDTAGRVWQTQMPGTTRWQIEAPFAADWQFSLLALVRCEVQAMDQHWSVHRLALTLPGGETDDVLATDLALADVASSAPYALAWPEPEPDRWQDLLRQALAAELATDLAAIRQRQEHYLRRELDRIDDYFAGYARELEQRRSRTPTGTLKTQERLAAARTEHERRRQDQVQRHEIRVLPHTDALVLIAEPAWRTRVSCVRQGQPLEADARYVPRARRWHLR